MNNAITYKCALLIENKFYSYSVTSTASVKYELNKWAYPPDWLRKRGFGLLCFDDLKTAINFVKNEYPTAIKYRSVILKCIAGNKIDLPPFCSMTKLSEGIVSPADPDSIEFPLGTIACNKLKPILIEWYIRGSFNDLLSGQIETMPDKINYVNENKEA